MSEPETTQSPTKKTPTTLSVAALIIAVCVAMLSGYQLYSSLYNNPAKQAISSLEKKSQQALTELQALKIQLTQSQDDRYNQTKNKLANVSYLIHLANLQLHTNHDAVAALNTLSMAQHYIASNNTPYFSALQQALSADTAALTATPAAPIASLFSSIHDLAAKINHLSSTALPPSDMTKNTAAQANPTNKALPWYRRVMERAAVFKTLFVIRTTDARNPPIMSFDQEAVIKQNIIMQLTMAQWALLHRHEKIYIVTLQAASRALAHYFSLSPEVTPLIAQITALEKIKIDNTLPTLSSTLTALSAMTAPPEKLNVTNQPEIQPAQPHDTTPKNDTASLAT
jgi:uncharacterized protein HemX